MRLSNCLRRFTRPRNCLLGRNSPRDHDRLARLGVEGLGDRTVPSAVMGSASPVVSVERIGDAAEGGVDGVFRFTRTGDATDALIIDVSYGGTAAKGDDYLPDSPFDCVTFPAGEASIDVSVRAFADGVYDPGETVAVTVLPPGFMVTGTYDLGTGYEAALTIADAPPPETGVLPPAVEPTWPTENTEPVFAPDKTSAAGPLPGSVDSNDLGNWSGNGGWLMRSESAGIPVTDPVKSDPLAGDDIGGWVS